MAARMASFYHRQVQHRHAAFLASASWLLPRDTVSERRPAPTSLTRRQGASARRSPEPWRRLATGWAAGLASAMRVGVGEKASVKERDMTRRREKKPSEVDCIFGFS
jgi:hypothetical protein